jgi:hypothetical protein
LAGKREKEKNSLSREESLASQYPSKENEQCFDRDSRREALLLRAQPLKERGEQKLDDKSSLRQRADYIKTNNP